MNDLSTGRPQNDRTSGPGSGRVGFPGPGGCAAGPHGAVTAQGDRTTIYFGQGPHAKRGRLPDSPPLGVRDRLRETIDGGRS